MPNKTKTNKLKARRSHRGIFLINNSAGFRKKYSKAFIAAFVLIFAGAGSFLAMQTKAATSTTIMGVYRGAARPDLVTTFEGWFGRKVPGALDFYPRESWSAMENNQSWQLKPWRESGYKTTLTIPMLPDDAGTLANGAAGDYNTHWTTIATNLVNANLGSSTLRIGHEFNGNWYKWAAQNDQASWPVYWRQIINTMRAVPGANFKFDWNPISGTTSMSAANVYPGDQYVDIIGADVYNQSWITNYTDPAARWNDIYNSQNGVKYWINFANSHNKPLSFPEWGTGTRPDGHGGGDDPNFIQQMYNIITTNNVAYHNYWDYCAPDICGEFSNPNTQFPQSAAKFKSLFQPLLPAAPAPEVSINDSTVGTSINQISYTGTWVPEGGYHDIYYLGNDNYSVTPNSTYKVQFSGSQIKLYGTKAPNGGIAAISIDGGTESLVDTYAATRADQQQIYMSPSLSNSTHTVTVRVTNTKNTASTNYVINADRAVVITGTPVSLPPVSDIIAPVVVISNPANGAKIGRQVIVSSKATDNVAVTSMTLYLDGVLKGSSKSGALTSILDTSRISKGSHAIIVKAYDARGNMGSISVTK